MSTPTIGHPNHNGKRLRAVLSALSGIPIALLYGVFARAVFASNDTSGWLSTMTCGFLFLVPVVIGALTVHLAPYEYRRSGTYAFFMPWLPCILTVIIIGWLGWEATLCIVLALPILLPLSSVGGTLAKAQDTSAPSQRNVIMGLLVLAPFLATPFETRLPKADDYRTVENKIVINASVDAVWKNIISVPLIQAEEQGFSVFHMLGLPKPLEATLSHEGIGGVRHATFEHGLTFVETVSEWNDHNSLRFTISLDKQIELPAPLNEIGGRYFDVLEGGYVIEPITENRVILHLSSRHRLSTRFNFYSGFWTDHIMSDLQSYILRIIKARAESASF